MPAVVVRRARSGASRRAGVPGGATAAQALLGPSFRITEHRGQVLHADPELNLPSDPQIVATVHPSAILRMRTGREDALESLVRDLRRAASLVG